MFEGRDEPLGRKDRINILLKEYDSLRADIVLRTNNLFTLMGISGAALIGLLSLRLGYSLWPPLLTLAGVSLLIWWVITQNIRRAASRLVSIEEHVNRLAGGEALLVWETHWGGAKIGWFRSRLSGSNRSRADALTGAWNGDRPATTHASHGK
jgi:hypothetical protein